MRHFFESSDKRTNMALSRSVLVLLMIGATMVSGEDYCSICKDHTMCQFKGVASACGKKTAGGVDAKAKAEILKIHNDLRRKIAQGSQPKNPPAANMREMKWDDELAKVAQMWADQCDYGHDACRDVPRFKVGQNARISSSDSADTTPEWTRGVQSWYDEVSLWKPSNINPFDTVKGAGHFTQLVWAESYLIGCGYVAYTAKGENTKYYICNYGPRGNMKKAVMYLTGKACSKCPAGTTCKADLCA